MAGYRKLGRTSSQRKALIRGQVTSLLNNGKIVTTETRAKEIRKVAEGLIALAVKEKDNFDEVEVTAKVARLDKDGKRVKEVVDGKKVTVFDEVKKTIKKDQPSCAGQSGSQWKDRRSPRSPCRQRRGRGGPRPFRPSARGGYIRRASGSWWPR